MNGGRAFARNFSGGKRAAFENAVQNFFDAKSKAVGFGKALDFRFAITRPQNDGELAEAVNSLVVHFHNNDPFKVRENFFQCRSATDECGANESHRLFRRDRARVSPRRGSGHRSIPSRRATVAFFVAINFRHRNFLGEFAQFIAAFRRHRPCAISGCRSDDPFRRARGRDKSGYLPSRIRVPGGDVLRDPVDRVGLESLARREVGFRIDHQFARSGSSNASIRVASEVSLKMKTGVLYLRAIRAASIAM